MGLSSLPGRALLAFASRPRRPSNLSRISRDATVRERQAAAAAWADGQFQLIESAVPGLDRVGIAVDDACWASRSPSGWMVSHSDPWHVSCTRNVTVVYATSGDAAGPLSALADSAGASGWGYYGFPDPVARLGELLVLPYQQHGVCEASPGWRPRAGVVPPPQARPLDHPRAVEPSVHISIQAERRPPAAAEEAAHGPRRLLDRKRAGPPTITPLHHPMETSEADIATLAEQAFARGGPVIAVMLRVAYYGG